VKAAARVAGWWALIALAALACLWSTADLLARQGALLGLPAPLLTGGSALTARAWQAYRGGDMAGAQALADEALERRPVDAATLRVAGLTAIAAGDGRRGDALMRLAGGAGWRDLPTQLYWAEVAMNAGAWDVAAERLDAVARMMPTNPRGRALLLRMEARPAGRAALARRLAIPNIWAPVHLTDIAGLDAAALDARVAMLQAARQAGVAYDDAVLYRLEAALLGRGRSDLALRLRPRPRGQWINPFELASSAGPGPFGWVLEAAPGLDATIEPRGRGRALHVLASGPGLLPFASQTTLLPPGRARFAVTVQGAKSPMPLVATIGCSDGSAATVVQEAPTPDRYAARLTVPVGCRTQRLILSVTGEEARRGADLWLSAPTLAPIATGAP
jgi:hypothetical protein